MFCRSCGNPIETDTRFCPHCGQAVSGPEAPGPDAPAPAARPTEAPGAPAPFPPAAPMPPPAAALPPAPARRKKRHGCLIAFLVILALLVAGAVAVYFLLPGLFRPVDLGVHYTERDYESVLEKLGYEKDEAPQSGTRQDYKYEYGPVVPVETRLSAAEVTAFFNLNRPSYFPLKDVQIRIGTQPEMGIGGWSYWAALSLGSLPATSDLPIEVSANVDRDYALDSLLSEYSREEIQEALASIGILDLIPERVNGYAKVSGRIENNKVVDLRLYAASVMGVAVPADIVRSADAHTIVAGLIDKLLENYHEESGAVFVTIRAENGEILLEGELPSSLTRTPLP